MDKIKKNSIDITGRSIAKNTIFNFLGYGFPLLFAVMLIPLLIDGLGLERFGILSLVWIVIGYLSFFDLGIGKGLTKIISEKIGSEQTEQIPEIFWNSMFIMLCISLLISVVFFFAAPTIVSHFFKISTELQPETLNTFYLLSLSLPLVITTTALRGVLEAYQKFGIINIIRVFIGIMTFTGPLLVLYFTNNLFWIALFLILIRILIWILYFIQCFKVNNQIKKKFKLNVDFKLIKPVLKFSIWITIGNIVGPIILYSDRFLIGALLSASAITYYVSPYEVATKLFLIPASLVVVVFPLFSVSFNQNPEISKSILLKAVKFTFLLVFPMVFLLVTFASEGMALWLGKEFAEKSYFVLQFLSIGILMNSFSIMPNNFFQGIGKPHIPTLINVIELPFYLLIMAISIKSYGVKGAAVAYMVLAMIDTFIMYLIAYWKLDIVLDKNFLVISLIFISFGLVTPFLINNIFFKIVFAILLISLFLIIILKFLLTPEEKDYLRSRLKLKIVSNRNFMR